MKHKRVWKGGGAVGLKHNYSRSLLGLCYKKFFEGLLWLDVHCTCLQENCELWLILPLVQYLTVIKKARTPTYPSFIVKNWQEIGIALNLCCVIFFTFYVQHSNLSDKTFNTKRALCNRVYPVTKRTSFVHLRCTHQLFTVHNHFAKS